MNGNYEPSNCRWATMDVQRNNKTTTRYLTYGGYTFSLRDWSRILGLDLRAFWWRLFTANWKKDDAILKKNASKEKWSKEQLETMCETFIENAEFPEELRRRRA